jgi:energy-coupling factor transport system ATP-binding protein
MSVIEVDNVSYSYRLGEKESVPALSSVSFFVEEGEFLTVVGKNGSGKSTLAKLLNGLLLPQSGTVKVDGKLTSDENTIFEVRKAAGMVFQNPDNQMVATIVEDDVAFGPENVGIESDEIKRRVAWALETVGMSAYRKHSASRLSGGQKQRIAIAGVLALKPKILILDEATSMLDPKGRQEVLSVAKKLNDDGITVILITHNMDEVAHSKRVLVLDNGSISFDGTPKKLFLEDGVLNSAGLSLPPVAKLAAQLNNGGMDVSKNVLFIDELVGEICARLK